MMIFIMVSVMKEAVVPLIMVMEIVVIVEMIVKKTSRWHTIALCFLLLSLLLLFFNSCPPFYWTDGHHPLPAR